MFFMSLIMIKDELFEQRNYGNYKVTNVKLNRIYFQKQISY